MAQTDLERQVETARQYGYSDEEIQTYLGAGSTSIGVVAPTPASPIERPDYTPAERRQLNEGLPIERQIDRTRGASFGERAMASFKGSPRERVEFWKFRQGRENVVVDPRGNILIQDLNSPGNWHPVDPAGPDWGDVADFAGDIPELAAMAAAGPLGVLRAGASAVGGNLLKQIMGAALPGQVEGRPLERAGEAAMAGVGGAAATAVGKAVGGAANVGETARAGMKDFLTKDISPAMREEGLRLEKETGGQLLPSQITGSKNLALAEGYVRRNPFAAEKMAQADLEQRMKPVAARAEAILEKLSSARGAGAENLGMALKESMEKGIEAGWDVTNKQANLDFKVLEGLAGKLPSLPLTNYRAGLEEIVQRFGAPEFGATANSVAAQAKKILKSVGTEPVSAAKLQDMMRFLGQSAYGRAPSMFKDVPIPFSKEIAQDLHKLLRADLSVAADTAPKGSAASLLRQARSNYEKNIGNVHGLQESLLSRYLGRSPNQMDPATLGEWFLKQQPGTISGTLKMLETSNPSLAGFARAHVLERAIEAGRVTAEKETAKYGIREGRFAMDAFLKSLPDDDTMKALYGGSGQNGAQVHKEIRDLIAFTERALQTSPSGTIQQPMFHQVGRLMRNFTLAGFVSTFGARGMATAITNPEARKVFIGLAEAKNPIAMQKAQEAAKRVMPMLIYELGASANQEADPNRGR